LTIIPIDAPRRRYVQVAEQLLDAIARGDYPAGSRLPGDREIAMMAQVSRPTAREAILALELVGAVEVRHGAGVYVVDSRLRSAESAAVALGVPQELIEARVSVEPTVARLCAQRATPDEIAGLRTLVDDGEAVTRDGGPYSRLSQLGLRFHTQLAQCCRNRLLADIVGHFVQVEDHPLWVLANELALRNPEAQQEQVNEHRAILAAIEAGDADRAATEMSVHLQRLSQYLFGPSPGELSVQGAPPPGELSRQGARVAGPVSRNVGKP
jgi:DNA-binding FadR family transcriptional regulator